MNMLLFLMLVGLVSLAIGSFLNVVIYRLPSMLKKQWLEECEELLKQKPAKATTTFNLAVPRSHCPYCKKTIAAKYNIPIISYILLRGKCPYCKHKISWRYPLVELICLVLSVIVAAKFGISIQTVALLPLTWALIVLVFIDFEQLLLPDIITIPLLWIGLLLSLFGVFCSPSTAIIGAAAGFLSLWLIAYIFKLIRGMEGMGQGDFKLLAMFGAWAGWQTLPFIVFYAALLGAIIGITYLVLKKYSWHKPIPFGPYLALAGWVGLIWGQNIFAAYLHFVGLR
jgi:leader peptidase (prepilin peptidase)/N-methyltransferase